MASLEWLLESRRGLDLIPGHHILYLLITTALTWTVFPKIAQEIDRKN